MGAPSAMEQAPMPIVRRWSSSPGQIIGQVVTYASRYIRMCRQLSGQQPVIAGRKIPPGGIFPVFSI